MTTLRTVRNVWHVERRNRNAEAIADRAGRLYEKFVGFLDDMQELGKRLDGAKAYHVEAIKKLSSGQGNLVRQAEQLKSLGAKTNKSIAADFLEESALEALPPISAG